MKYEFGFLDKLGQRWICFEHDEVILAALLQFTKHLSCRMSSRHGAHAWLALVWHPHSVYRVSGLPTSTAHFSTTSEQIANCRRLFTPWRIHARAICCGTASLLPSCHGHSLASCPPPTCAAGGSQSPAGLCAPCRVPLPANLLQLGATFTLMHVLSHRPQR